MIKLDKKEVIDLIPIQDLLKVKNYPAIIEDSEKFWALFCKVFSERNVETEDTFSVVPKVDLSGKTTQLVVSNSEKIKKCIEVVRSYFQESANGNIKNFTILPIPVAQDCYFRKQEQVTYYDLSHSFYNKEFHIYEGHFEKFIRPTMHYFTKSLGASCSSFKVEELVKVHLTHPGKYEINALKIEWNTTDHYVYPIPPREISPRESDPMMTFYKMYQNKKFCDLTLIDSQGETIQIHLLPFVTYGGGALEKMVSSEMKESKEKCIHFKMYSMSVIKMFIDYIYLGPEGFTPESFKNKYNPDDLEQLLEMASLYEVKPLIDCCTNLFSLFFSDVSKEELEKLSCLADLYKNEHLQELVKHLSPEVEKAEKLSFLGSLFEN